MRTFILASAFVAFALPAMAQDLSMGTHLGTTMDEVKASLVSMGYEVRKGEMEDGKIEVYVVKDSTTGEVYVDGSTGNVAKLTMK